MTYKLLRNGTLIDGNGGSPLPNAAVLIKDNRIAVVGSDQSISLPDAPVEIIDVQGGTIMPGIVDTHVHLMIEGVDLMTIMREPFSLPFYRAVGAMQRTLNAGVTSVRDAGGADLGLKRAVEQGLVDGPRMQISVSIMSITGGHVDFYMPNSSRISLFPAYPGRPDAICDGIDGVRLKVREILRAGADIIKICSTGGVMSPTDHPEFSQFSPEELDVIVREAAYRRGTKVMAHAQGLQGIRHAVEAGVHSIEHGIFLDEAVCELMVEKGTFVVPTFLAVKTIIEQSEAANVPEWGIRKAREVMEIHMESIALAHKMGVKIAMGTDAVAIPHGANLRELQLMTRIGMSPMETIVASTKTAAQCLQWDDQLGTVEAGKLADVIVSRTDPLSDIGSLGQNDNIMLVMKDGQMYKRLIG